MADEAHIPSLEVGWTLLYGSSDLVSRYGVQSVFVKDDGRNSTGSLTDRVSAIGAAKVLNFGQKIVACASTGNAASAFSGFAACAGPASYLFAESAGVTGFAGFRKMALRGDLRADERIAVIVTGNCLKDIANSRKAVGFPILADPDIEDLAEKPGK